MTMPEQTDPQLLEAYCRAGDEAAFRRLVERHTPMVYRACLRKLQNPHEAQDACQATFVVLARKARSLRAGDLSHWLYDVALKAAMQALRNRARRHEHEQQASRERAILEALPMNNTEHEQVLACLDGEIARLSAPYRQAVVLRYLEGHNQAEAARLAGCTMNALSMRASRGIGILRERLAKLGLAVSVPALVGLLEAEAQAAVPATLVSSIVSTVQAASAAGAAASATTNIMLLAKGAMQMMFWHQVKVAALVAAGAALLGGAGVATHRLAAPAASPDAAPAVALPATAEPAPAEPAAVSSPEPAVPPPVTAAPPGNEAATAPAADAIKFAGGETVNGLKFMLYADLLPECKKCQPPKSEHATNSVRCANCPAFGPPWNKYCRTCAVTLGVCMRCWAKLEEQQYAFPIQPGRSIPTIRALLKNAGAAGDIYLPLKNHRLDMEKRVTFIFTDLKTGEEHKYLQDNIRAVEGMPVGRCFGQEGFAFYRNGYLGITSGGYHKVLFFELDKDFPLTGEYAFQVEYVNNDSGDRSPEPLTTAGKIWTGTVRSNPLLVIIKPAPTAAPAGPVPAPA